MSGWEYPLRRGSSPDPSKGACLLDAVSWVVYGRPGDRPECVDAQLIAYGIQLNDWLPSLERQRLRVFIPRLAGTRVDDALTKSRGNFIVQRANDIARAAGLRLRGDHYLQPHVAYDRALQVCTWSQRDRLLYTPAIALLGQAIDLGARVNQTPIAAPELDAAVERFRLARAA